MAASSLVFDPPPPYPGRSSAFALPPYETAAALDTWWDSYCLPPYQSRTGQRYHPYMRILPVHRGYIPHQEKSFEEFYRSLQASADRRAGTSSTVVGVGVGESSSTTVQRTPVEAEPANPPGPQVATPRLPDSEGFLPLPPPVPKGPPPPHALAQDPGLDPEERRHRLIDHLFLLPEIIRIVCAGLGAALRATEARF